MRRMYVLAFSLVAICAPASAGSQPAQTQTHPPSRPDVAAQKMALSQLAFLVGQWEGEGWILMRGQRYEFRQTEHVRYNLDGAIMLIDGRGYAADAVQGAAPIFTAFAVVSFEDREGEFNFRSYSRGHAGDYPARMREDGGFEWSVGSMRYRIWAGDDGQWFETGEAKSDEGWTQFFEMSLSKVDEVAS